MDVLPHGAFADLFGAALVDGLVHRDQVDGPQVRFHRGREQWEGLTVLIHESCDLSEGLDCNSDSLRVLAKEESMSTAQMGIDVADPCAVRVFDVIHELELVKRELAGVDARLMVVDASLDHDLHCFL